MLYTEQIMTHRSDPAQLESLYRQAIQANQVKEFEESLRTCYHQNPSDLLYAAWFFRLQPWDKVGRAAINWALVIALGILNSLILYLAADETMLFLDQMPYLLIVWAPISALFVMAFLYLSHKENLRRHLLIGLALVIFTIYILLIVPTQPTWAHEHTSIILILHLPLLAWAGTGISIMGLRSGEERFAFLIKSLEVFITGGLFGMAWGVFSMITIEMFRALNINLSNNMQLFIVIAGCGMIPVAAVASIFNPHVSPHAQDFRQGLSKFIAHMMRLLLPFTLLVLVIYAAFIPFNFLAPFYEREVLIIYNAMLFAVMAMLLGATPVQANDISPRLQLWLRRGILAVAILASLVSIYALSATVYRTILGGITINRTVIIGWNMINIGLLVLLITRQFRSVSRGGENWVEALHIVFCSASIVYTIWSAILIIFIPLLFR